MSVSLLMRAFAVWVLLLLGAMLNGGIRQWLLVPWMGELSGHVVSALLLSLAVVTITAMLSPLLTLGSGREAWLVGAWWLMLTLAFEFLAGHYVFNVSWGELLADYNIGAGRIWVLVLATTLASPRVVYSWRQ
jgi:hypothetical protein